MSLKELFARHVERICDDAEKALAEASQAEASYEGILFHAGTQDYYHADDRAVDFRPVPHFARFAPVQGPEHLLLFRPGARPRLCQVVPSDYWYEPPAEPQHPYAEVLQVTRVGSRDEGAKQLGDLSRCAYIGNAPRAAAAMGIPLPHIEPKVLVAALDWFRAFKTPYEVHCMREAASRAARGHQRVREGFHRGETERRLHAAYLEATQHLEFETPYTNIIAWDEGAAILHYQSKRNAAPDPGAVLLIDAGAVEKGYASDITRTYANDRSPETFRTLLDGMDVLQRDLVSQVGPGKPYVDLHLAAHRGVAQLLHDVGILKTSPEESVARGFTRPFLPHGLGHHLGLQVHDVGGHQIDPRGTKQQPPAEHPYLRTTRPLDVGHVVTIEPGLYFIPMLLDPLREGTDATVFDWKQIDQLVPYGGIRIEDDVLVTSSGQEDLTRPLLPGHRNV